MYEYYDFTRRVRRLGLEIIWTRNDTKYSIACSVIPLAVSFRSLLSASNNQNLAQQWKIISETFWAPKNSLIYGFLDILTMLPHGYASYRIYKYGGGFKYCDTIIALGFYGAALFASLFSLPFFTKTKSDSFHFHRTFLMHLMAIGTVYTFYKIDSKASLLMIPYAVWTGCYTFLANGM